MPTEIVESKAVCRKCKSNNLTLVEIWRGHNIEWDQDGGKLDIQEGVLNPGDPYKVEATCKDCGHSWKIRGAIQIGNVIK